VIEWHSSLPLVVLDNTVVLRLLTSGYLICQIS